MQKECFFPVTYSVNRLASGFTSSGFPISGAPTTSANWITLSYTPPTTVGLIGIKWQGFFYDNALETYILTSLGMQVSYRSLFTDTAASLEVDVGNIIFWDEFSYAFTGNFGAGVNRQRYSYFQMFNPYAYFVPANTTIYLFPYIRIPAAFRDTAVIEQSITLHLVTTNRNT